MFTSVANHVTKISNHVTKILLLKREEAPLAVQLLPIAILLISFGVVWYIHRHRSMTNGTTRSFGSVMFTLICVVIYCVSGPGVILANKHIIADTPFSFPVAVSTIGILFSFLFASLLAATGLWPLENDRPLKTAFKDVMPVGVLSAANNGFSNAAFIYLPVSLLQMVKPTTIVLVFIIVILMQLERPSFGTYVSVTIITAGSFLVVYSEHMNQSFPSVVEGALFIGLSLQFGAILSEAVKTAMTQYLYQRAKMPFLDSMLYTMAVILVLQIALIFLFEFQPISMLPLATFNASLLFLCCLSGAFGILLNFSTFWITKEFGAVPFKVLTEARNLMIVYAGVVLRSESLYLWQSLSFCVILVGVAMYANEKIYDLDSPTKDELEPLLVDVEQNRAVKAA